MRARARDACTHPACRLHAIHRMPPPAGAGAAPAGAQDRENVRLFIEHIAAIELTQAEVVQLINLKPTERVTVHAVVEKCARRLTEDEVDDLLHLCEKYL